MPYKEDFVHKSSPNLETFGKSHFLFFSQISIFVLLFKGNLTVSKGNAVEIGNSTCCCDSCVNLDMHCKPL